MMKSEVDNYLIFIKAFLGGICISIGCNIYLACENRVIGAFLFSIGLITILLLKFNLFTGKIGYLFRGETFRSVGLTLLGNTIGCMFIGLMFRNGAAEELCAAKLNGSWLMVLPKAFMCGILMYIAVEIYRSYKSILPAILCVAIFILSGYEHSIADIAYFVMSGALSFQSLCFIVLVIIGNCLGGLFIPLCNDIIHTVNTPY